MEFDDMQVIWNSEKQEKMFTIDEAALRAMVERKGKVIAQMMQNVEWIFITGNFLIALFLLYKMISEDYTVYAYIMPLLYFGYSIYMLVRKRNRKHEQSQVYFAETMVGEIDKALWRTAALGNCFDCRRCPTVIFCFKLGDKTVLFIEET